MKIIKYILISLLMSSFCMLTAFAQQMDTIKYSSPVKIETFNGSTFLTTKKYFDGLGRLVQSIDVGASAKNARDVVSFVVYDDMGRADATTYLPYVVSSASNNGGQTPNPVLAQSEFYKSYLPVSDTDRDYAYAQKQYDNSPLGLVLKEGSVGQSNNMTVGIPVNHEYKIDLSNSIKKFTVNNNGELVYNGYHNSSLSVHRSYSNGPNEDSHDTYEYVNSLGQLIAKEVRVSSSDRRITYYVYDDFGRQRYIIPPIQESQINSVGSLYTPEQLQKYCYIMNYDDRGNQNTQWDPARGWTSYIYDQFGRLILSQDRKLSTTNQWTFVKYDSKNRPIISGVTILQGNLQTLTDELRNHIAGDISGRSYETRDKNNSLGYTNNCYPSHESGLIGSPVPEVLYFSSNALQPIAQYFTYKAFTQKEVEIN